MLRGFRQVTTTNRRQFLQASAAGGAALVVGFNWTTGRMTTAAAQAAGTFAPNAFVRIARDNLVIVVAKHLEMGQGAYTGLATILAEELDADWAQVRVESAPADATRYNNTLWGPVQGTGGSSAMANSYEQLRKAGATARAMLVQAAAQAWNVPVGAIKVDRGVVIHAESGRSARFGELAERAAALKPPADVPLKDPRNFRLIGAANLPRVDTKAKSNGTAQFALDVRPQGALTALIARPPLFGAAVKSFNADKAKAVAGVTDVVQVPGGVAVVGQNFWAARKGREALEIEWDDAKAEKRGSAELIAEYKRLAATPGTVARKDGDVERALSGAAKTVEAVFEFPYLAHAPMEPLNCVVQLGANGCDIWAGDQFQTIDQANAAAAAGLKPEQVRIHTVFAGGSFGRRANPGSDYIVEGVQVAKAIGGRAPVKLVWTREDDVRGGRYRPLYIHAMRAALDAEGNPVAWQHRIVGQSILAGTPFEPMMVKNGVDLTSVEGAQNLPYGIPNLSVELHTTKVGVPVLWWRSVGSTHTAFSTEILIDELAAAAGKDPYEFRRSLLAKHPRHLAALDLAAEKAGWRTPLPQGKARGIAVHESFGSFVAQVAEIAINGGEVKVERVVCAVDCGIAINPDVIRAQMEGGIGFGLGAALAEAITIEGGRVQQSNFDDYTPLRIDQMPKVEVHIVPSAEPPTGVGEPGVPPIAPAVANAIAAATGQRIRSLPFAQHKLG
jgi:isoquinoline 1-oxidoreductase subunit beta